MSRSSLFGKYQIIGILGEGATSKVYLAMHETLQHYRAIKCISKCYISFEQVKKEVDLLNQSKSPMIPTVYDIEEDQENIYIIEEYMEGESLLSYRNRVQHLSESLIIEFALQICNLIYYLHSLKYPILYLDLKPSNLIVHENSIKLTDFGAARYKNGSKQLSNYGTKGFAAPEQYLGSKIDETTDIYGIGMLMYFLMTGNVNMNSNVLPNIKKRHEYSAALCRFVSKSIKHNPSERYFSVQMMKYNLLRLKQKERKKFRPYVGTKRIAIVGACPKSGASHLAFTLLAHLKREGVSSIYVECNSSNVVATLARQSEEQLDNHIIYEGCFLTRAEWFREQDKLYEYIIYDYGAINQDCIEQFLNADISICVCGGKPWEIVTATKIMEGLNLKNIVTYVVNHLEAKEFYQLVKRGSLQQRLSMSRQILRMPQQCNPWGKPSGSLNEFIKSILE